MDSFLHIYLSLITIMISSTGTPTFALRTTLPSFAALIVFLTLYFFSYPLTNTIYPLLASPVLKLISP
ncbi:hypothetical protein BDQ17DRAFT_1356025 [Cyathus striatus]|nr:hypothetical protein BDQ17DRAFT_1356025 [Cyathus striatus]